MRARRLIFTGGFGPDDVVYLTDVLENVWREIENSWKPNGLDKTAARETLALTIIRLAPRSARLTSDEFQEEVKRMFLTQIQTHISVN